ncbi:hypothetical protein N5D61_03805 [Pseudomonas sp. GD03842]|uniref:hypothetical protein n=1 Tax=Pseudomonas sp. GD03842 TaxID=2975385 RepID=UPI00244B9F4D|nr:hypothetical protein [Pseudomonas sp. GD03842]MDH0745470.1 hypothetical protein [Pseudomonas sp. GD03842]
MVDHQAEGTHGNIQGNVHKHLLRRQKVMLGLGLLLAVVVMSVAAIVLMLQRLEAKNATFQPPMTALERQRLLPTDPVLDTAPKIDGLRYRDQVERTLEDFAPTSDASQEEHPPLSHALILQSADLHADAHANLPAGRAGP